MKIAIISDTHFGYAWGTEREGDSFDQAKEAFDSAKDCDAIILPGDIFDSRVPKQEVLEKGMRVLQTAVTSADTGVLVNNKTVRGIPMVAIHGTHERRASELANPVQTLEASLMITYLHCGSALLEKNGERVVIHGMSGVPESFAPDVLSGWNPKPLQDAKNIMVLHQGFKEAMYEDAAFLTLNDLPYGFDLYVNGHIHDKKIIEKEGKKLLIPGSTITTQMKKEEEVGRGFYVYDTASGALEFREIKTCRKLFYRAFSFENVEPQKVREKVNMFLQEKLSKEFEKKPLVRIKLTGSLKTGNSVDKKQLLAGFEDKAIFSFDNEMSASDFKKKISELRELHAKKSIDELGMSLLQDALKQAECDLDGEKLFDLLAEGDEEKLMQYFNKPSF